MTAIPYTSLLSHETDIEKRNELFHALTDEQKRREIAYDALILVLHSGIHASDGNYWGWSLEEIMYDSKNSKDFQESLIVNLPTCDVCARGLMMLSTIRLGNRIEPHTPHCTKGKPELIQGFEFSTFLEMEAEYEGEKFGLPYCRNTDEKLANICCNILHNGDFNIEDSTDYLTLWGIVIKKPLHT